MTSRGTLRWPKYGFGPEDEFMADDTEPIGTGGQATVVAAWQRGLKRRVAVKAPLDQPAAAAVLDALMAQEAAALAALDHPDIVGLHAIVMSQQGRPALAMERVDGVPWLELLGDHRHPIWVAHGEHTLGPDAPDDARLEAHLRILMRICSAVQHVNTTGIVHGDLKPANVVVGPLGRATLLDFGIARNATDDTSPAAERGMEGTAAFMAPEVANGAAPDKVASDVFTLGAILHLILTGKGPYQKRSAFSTLVACASGEREPNYPASTPVALAEVCERAIAFEPADRYRSAGAVRLAIDTFLRRRTAAALLDDAIERITEWIAQMGPELPDPNPDPAEQTLTGTAPELPEDAISLEEAWQAYQDCHMRLEAVRNMWSDNIKVAEWSGVATTKMAQIALSYRDLDLADQLIVRLDEPAELRQRWNELHQARLSNKEALVRLQSLVDDADNSSGWAARRNMIAGIAIAVGGTLFINGEVLRLGWAKFGLADVQWTGFLWLFLCLIGIWRSWSSIAPNLAARRQVHALLVLVSVGALNWPLCYQLGLTHHHALNIMLFWIGLCGHIASFALLEPRFAKASTAVMVTLAVSILVPGWEFHFSGLALWVAAVLIVRS